MIFWVVDKKTGREADPEYIALHEDWAKGLIYCDMEGFALLDNGQLILVDECGNYEFCPPDRFEIVKYEEQANDNEPLTWDEFKQMIGKPVWVETDNGGLWGILQEIRENDIAYLVGVENGLVVNIFCPRISVNTWNVYRKERK